jgi:signal transduction histidine kinase
MKKGRRIGYMETKRKTKSGKVIDVSLSLSPITDASGKVIALSSIERDITHRKQMEEALRKSRDELEKRVKERTAELENVNQTLQTEVTEREQTQEQLRSLSAILAKTEERERRRIATDLHDRIIQTLVYANMKLGELRKTVAGAGAPETADEVGRYVQQTIHDLRTLTFELSPPVLYELGFVPAVKWLLRQFEEKQDLVVEFQENDVPEAIDEDVRIVLFQSLRELLNNAVKHARARCVKVTLYRDENALKAVVEDDGIGFDSRKTTMNPKDNTGFGIFNIRQRLESVNGGLAIDSKPGAGTRIEMTAPLKS